MDGASVFRDYSNGQSSIYLIRAMCLVTCKFRQAASSLRLREGDSVLQPLEFAKELLDGLDVAIKADLEPDRVTKIQILSLMHLHNDGVSGADRSASYLSQAICEAWSLSLHHNIPGNWDQAQCDCLWWSLRNLDRLNKPVMGAGPFMIDDADVGIERIAAKGDSYRSQLMHVSLVLGDLMKTATKMYKASLKVRADDSADFPSLADLTSRTNFEHFHRSHRAYLEIWYHVCAMFSCRYSGPGSVQYNRRLTSADRILEIISKSGHESLPPLPLVPYAMSMSTTMIYRALRDDQRDIKSASKDLRLCCDALDGLGKLWTSAKCVAKLAKRLLRVLNKPGVLNGAARNGSEHIPNGSRSQAPGVTVAYGSVNMHPQHNGPPYVFPPVPSPASQQLQQQVPGGDQTIQGQIIEDWSGIDASDFQISRAFDDLFDYSMPNVFRDPTTWEFTHVTNDEESPLGGGYHFGSNFTSPDLELGYHNYNVNGS